MALPVYSGVVLVAVADPDEVLGRLPEQVCPPAVQVTACAGHPQSRLWGLRGQGRPPHPAGTVVFHALLCVKFTQSLQLPQFPRQFRGCVPVAGRLVSQSPSLQRAAHVLVCVKEVSQAFVEVAGDHGSLPQGHAFVPVACRVLLSAQSPVLQPSLQSLVLVWVKEASQAFVEVAGDHADHGSSPQRTMGGFCLEQVPEFDPPLSPSQRHW